MKVLVTGAGGFLGRYLVEKLVARGDHVRAFSRRSYPELAALGVECQAGDIRDGSAVSAACEGRDTVFHAAAIAGIWGRWDDFYQTNTLGTRHVLEGCRRGGVRKLVYTSSPSVTFDGSDQCGIDESTPYPSEWLCHYPHSKALAEAEVLQADESDGLLTCALRPHLIWGPRDAHLIPRLLARARAGQLRQVGSGENLIDMVYVENAADAHLDAERALEPGSPACGSAYFISQGEPVNCWEWINEILQLARLPQVSRSISLQSAWRIGAVLERVYQVLGIQREPRMTRFLAAQLGKSHYYRIDRARAEIGYEPRISTPEGMRRLAKSWANG